MTTKSSERAKKLAGMFGAVDADALAQQAKAEKPTGRHMTTAPTKALQASFASIEEENIRLKSELERAAIVELDPNKVLASLVQDRLDWSEDAPEFQSLVSSIKSDGQKLPILVRPHPTEKDCYQLAYGARRNRACKVLGLKVRAYVQNLDDEELVIAQGLENNERKNLSFIEQAVYARALSEGGYTRKLIAKSVGVADETNVSKMTAITKQIPMDIIDLIGSAPKIGRDRWDTFSKLMEAGQKKAAILDDVRGLASSDVWKSADTNRRFDLALRTAEKASQHKKPKPKALKTPLENDGRSFGVVEQSNTMVKITIDAKNEPDFAYFITSKLGALMGEFQKKERGERDPEQ